MNWIVLATSLGVGFAVVATSLMARRYSWLWGRVPSATALVNKGPFRTSEVATYRAAGVPTEIKVSSALNIVWGLLTALVFAPAGLLFCLIGADISLPGTLAVFAVSVHGFWLAGRLFGASKGLMRQEGRRLVATARASLIHHIAVLASFAFMLLIASRRHATEAPALFAATVVPCALGIALALQLELLGRRFRDELGDVECVSSGWPGK